MPKLPQVVVAEGKGRARRLMVRAKKGSKRAHERAESFYCKKTLNPYTTRPGVWIDRTVKSKIDGCFRGTKKVPKDNAMKHPETKLPQVAEVLVQMGLDLASLPPSEAEFYWQKGNLMSGNRFVPDKEAKVKPLPDPQSDQPTP